MSHLDSGLVLPDGSPARSDELAIVSTPEGDLVASEAKAEELERQFFRELPDDELIERICMVEDERNSVTEQLKSLENLAKDEIKRRLKERGARAFTPHDWLMKCELEDEYSVWNYDIAKLEEAGKLLPEAERVKLIVNVPEKTEVVPAHKEPGHPNSINALVKKYGAESTIGKAINAARSRSHLDTKLAWKRKALPA
jgi:hypothetical protein